MGRNEGVADRDLLPQARLEARLEPGRRLHIRDGVLEQGEAADHGLRKPAASEAHPQMCLDGGPLHRVAQRPLLVLAERVEERGTGQPVMVRHRGQYYRGGRRVFQSPRARTPPD